MYCYQPNYNILWLNGKWTLKEQWAQDKRFVNGEGEQNGERKGTHGERTVTARKNGRVERYRDLY